MIGGRFGKRESQHGDLHRGHDDVVFIGMPSQSGVVGFDVQFEMAVQVIMLQEAYDTHCIYKKVKRQHVQRDLRWKLKASEIF